MKETHYLRLTLLITAFFCYSTEIHAQSIVLTSDQQLEDLVSDPDKRIDMSTGHTSMIRSLRDVCEMHKKSGSRSMGIFFDEFFRQYRDDNGADRKLTPDMDEYVDKIKTISDFASRYDVGLCLSLLSPLELGPAYTKQTGKSGRWLAYKVGLRNPVTGRFSVPIWQHLYWTNNKGQTPVILKNAKAYAFKEKILAPSPYRVVNPDDILPLNDVTCEVLDSVNTGVAMHNLRVYGQSEQHKGYDKVLILLEYETQEMDYFDDGTLDFLKGLVKKYYDKNVNLVALYSDEMHIQQDWVYNNHHENGQFALRYLTESFAKKFGERYNIPFDDKYMLYFAYGAPVYEPGAFSVINVQYVMGGNPEDIHRTFLIRDRYYRMLNDEVVDLFKAAKKYAENLYKRDMPTHAHASWAESPTIDFWNYEKLNSCSNQYEYTSNFIWGNTVHQSASACSDYFKWSEYLVPTGNDFAECGWNDRNYYGAALAASIGVINKTENAYAAAWGMPRESWERRMAINYAFGADPPKNIDMITEHVHRDVDVLMLYPMNLVAVEERFGSWMTQYGYANYLTTDKLLEMGRILSDGKIQVGKKKYGTLATLFEPFPEKGLLDFMEEFVAAGGRVVWFSAPPLMDKEENNCTDQWQLLFGVKYDHDIYMGRMAPGRQIEFHGSFAGIPSQTILTDFLIDRIYPVQPMENTEVSVILEKNIIGTLKKYTGGGIACYCGFRPRDDQSQSLGYETRTLFEILNAIDAYPSTGKFRGVNDNPSYLSRTTDYFVSTFPNTTTMVVKHYRTHPETWPGGFSRNRDEDMKILADNPVPSGLISLKNAKINGHEVSYEGNISLAFRTDMNDRLISFDGYECKGIDLDGAKYEFSSQPVTLTFAPVNGKKNEYQILVKGNGEICIPLPLNAKSATIKKGKQNVNGRYENGNFVFTLSPELNGQWLDMKWN